MIVAFSTSGSLASVALIDGGRVIFARSREAPRRALEAVMGMLAEAEAEGFDWRAVTDAAADVGPGSFTGVRVGVVLAKTIAWTVGGRCYGADAFDLVDPFRPVARPSKKGEWFLRTPEAGIVRTTEPPAGSLGEPLAERFADLLPALEPEDPFLFAPHYGSEPSISTPKRGYGTP